MAPFLKAVRVLSSVRVLPRGEVLGGRGRGVPLRSHAPGSRSLCGNPGRSSLSARGQPLTLFSPSHDSHAGELPADLSSVVCLSPRGEFDPTRQESHILPSPQS